MSWVQMADTPAGLAVNFYDYQDAPPYGTPGTVSDGFGLEDNFIFTNVASGLARSVPHTVKVEMFLVDGPHNDIVRIYVDGTLMHTGTSWDDYFRWTQGPGGPEQTATMVPACSRITTRPSTSPTPRVRSTFYTPPSTR